MPESAETFPFKNRFCMLCNQPSLVDEVVKPTTVPFFPNDSSSCRGPGCVELSRQMFDFSFLERDTRLLNIQTCAEFEMFDKMKVGQVVVGVFKETPKCPLPTLRKSVVFSEIKKYPK